MTLKGSSYIQGFVEICSGLLGIIGQHDIGCIFSRLSWTYMLLYILPGNYLLCVRPVNDETPVADGERPSSFEWSDDVKGVKAVHISGLFDKLSHHIKKTFYGQTAECCFSMIHCGLNT